MARFTGFLVQALLVVLSFWLNVCHNTETLRGGFPGVVSAPAATATENNAANDEASRALNASPADDKSADKGNFDPAGDAQKQSEQPSETDDSNEAVMNSTNSVDLAREEDSIIDESVSPKGGKLVSIPSVEVDALRGRRAADDRIIGVTKAELMNASARTPSNN